MRKTLLNTSVALASVAFANGAAAAKTAETPKTPDAPATETKAKPERVAPIVTAVSTAVTMPVRTGTRGAKSAYPFDSLTEVGASFGVTNKTLKSIATIVSNANRNAMVDKINANGAKVFKTTEMKAADGTVTHVPTSEIEKVAGKRFFAIETDPKTDPDKATVRVFREA